VFIESGGPPEKEDPERTAMSGKSKSFLLVLIAGAVAAYFPAGSAAANGADSWQGYKKLRYEEDYFYLRKAAGKDLFDPIKYIPLTGDGNFYLSLGGEIREHYEFIEHPAWGSDPQDRHGTLLQRYVLHSDLHLGENLRFFVQLLSALENGRKGGPSPVDEDRLTFQNAFLDLDVSVGLNDRLTLRGGRQEILLGSGRLVDVREGPNVRRKFDGGRIFFDIRKWQINGIAVRPVQDKPGVFDDGADQGRALWGLYSTGPVTWMPGSIDLYYLGFQNEHAQYNQGAGKETRNSLGARFWGNPGNWDYNWEFVYQWGNFGPGDIQAWTAASITGYTWPSIPLTPRLGLSANIASGDHNPDDKNLETFNPLFPRGNYFSELAQLGPYNFFNVDPSLALKLWRGMSLTSDIDFFWRQRTGDGIYSPNGSLLRSSSGSKAKYVGTIFSLNAEQQMGRHLTATAIYTHFFPGAFIRETGPDKDIDYYEFTVEYLF
jgi:hypothetical protein